MKIKQTIERECCEPADLVLMLGSPDGQIYRFCKYCGRYWCSDTYLSCSDGNDDKVLTEGEKRPIPFPWEGKRILSRFASQTR